MPPPLPALPRIGLVETGWGFELFWDCCIGTAGNVSAGLVVSLATAAAAAAAAAATISRVHVGVSQSSRGEQDGAVPLLLPPLLLLLFVSGKDDLRL